jgi:hypothetical protein
MNFAGVGRSPMIAPKLEEPEFQRGDCVHCLRPGTSASMVLIEGAGTVHEACVPGFILREPDQDE